MSDDELDPTAVRSSQASMKSLFASDRASSQAGSQSLKYERKKVEAPPPVSGSQQGQTSVALQATVACYRGDTHIGTCAIVVAVQQAGTNLIIVDRDKRPHGRVRVAADMQLLQNETELQYATLYDPMIQQHWTLMFRSPTDCTNFVVGTLTIQHYLALAEGPSPPYIDLVVGSGKTVGKNDAVSVGLTTWLLKRVGQTAAFTVGKTVEEIPNDAPKKVLLGTQTLMVGIEEGVVSMAVGGKRLLFVPPRKTKVSGIGNPEVGGTDSVVCLVTVAAVEKEDGPVSGLSNIDEDDDIPTSKKAKKPAVTPKEEHPPQPAAAPAPAPAPASPTMPIASPAAPIAGMEGILQTMMLFQQVQNQLQPRHEPPPPPPAPVPANTGPDLERSIDRLHHQIASLYEKIDRIDLEGKLAKNNEVLERIVKKAVGKMPVNDVELEDMANDRDQLLAKIEHLKHRVEEMTDNYHKALEHLGKHKDETTSLKNDLAIERETSKQNLEDLKERHRLQLVEQEVKHRRALEKTQEGALELGKEEGYKRGYQAGKVDAIQLAGSSSADEMKEMLSKKDQMIVELESRIATMQAKQYEERREYQDRLDSLNNLVHRLEERDDGRAKEHHDSTSSLTKLIRRTMNSVYAAIESQFYATELQQINVEDALSMVLISIKTETKHATEEIKREAAERATRPVITDPTHHDTLVAAVVADTETDRYRRHEDPTAAMGYNAPSTEEPTAPPVSVRPPVEQQTTSEEAHFELPPPPPIEPSSEADYAPPPPPMLFQSDWSREESRGENPSHFPLPPPSFDPPPPDLPTDLPDVERVPISEFFTSQVSPQSQHAEEEEGTSSTKRKKHSTKYTTDSEEES